MKIFLLFYFFWFFPGLTQFKENYCKISFSGAFVRYYACVDPIFDPEKYPLLHQMPDSPDQTLNFQEAREKLIFRQFSLNCVRPGKTQKKLNRRKIFIFPAGHCCTGFGSEKESEFKRLFLDQFFTLRAAVEFVFFCGGP